MVRRGNEGLEEVGSDLSMQRALTLGNLTADKVKKSGWGRQGGRTAAGQRGDAMSPFGVLDPTTRAPLISLTARPQKSVPPRFC